MWENALDKIFVKQKISPTKILEAKKFEMTVFSGKNKKDELFPIEI
jgi:hypothetical protein